MWFIWSITLSTKVLKFFNERKILVSGGVWIARLGNLLVWGSSFGGRGYGGFLYFRAGNLNLGGHYG